MKMAIGNKAGVKIIRSHGYAFFCAYRRMRHIGYGMQSALKRARADHGVLMGNEDDDCTSMSMEVSGCAA